MRTCSTQAGIMGLIVRFRSKDGLFRLEGDASMPLALLLDDLVQTKLPPLDSSSLMAKTGKWDPIDPTMTLDQLGFRNGEMVELEYTKTSGGQSISGKLSEREAPVANVASSRIKVVQLPVDDELDNNKGLIPRGTSSLCRHSGQGMCEYCSPLPPWDQEYHDKNLIKHISFHSQLALLNSETNKETGSSFIPPLKPSDFKILKPCPSGHEPWPRGICSKCQPSAITLKRQKFRMVDHVEFQRADIVNNFIDAWRRSGVQRAGLLVGSYDTYDKTPLGIKAKVEAIYEFPQTDWEDGLMLNQWEEEEKVMDMIRGLGLYPVGVIFTDLSDAGKADGSVICKRHSDSFFLSSLEIVFAAKWQLRFPNVSRFAEGGTFSSKFVTCVVSGNTNGEIDIATYQASETAEALVKANLICGSTHPNQMFINKQEGDRYVPDIMYQMVNEYGLEVKRDAKPSFPVEYLIVSLTHGFPDQERGIFSCGNWPIENRAYLGEAGQVSQLPKTLQNAFNNGHRQQILDELSDFHLLLYLQENGILNSSEVQLCQQAVLWGANGQPNTTGLSPLEKLLVSPGWRSLSTIAKLSS